MKGSGNMRFIESFSLPLQMVIFVLMLCLGVVCLIKFCNVFLDSASLIAKKFSIPSIIIGLTIVAMGTSIPELAVSVSDAIVSLIDGGNANIGFSNVVGSNISNLLLVLSFSCLFAPILIKKETKLDYKILVVITFLLTILAVFFGSSSIIGEWAILRWEAIALVIMIIPYLTYIVINSNKKEVEEQIENSEEKITLFKPIVLLLISVGAIAIGGELVVYGAKGIALNISEALAINKDIAETLIGLTIVAVGTSLPELVTTVIASKRGENDMALGNVIGSNIFNTIFVLGISATISPFTISSYMIIDLFVLLFVTLLVFIFVMKGKMTGKHSLLLMTIYLIYIIYLIIRTII